jgi:hypothetical protein
MNQMGQDFFLQIHKLVIVLDWKIKSINDNRRHKKAMEIMNKNRN